MNILALDRLVAGVQIVGNRNIDLSSRIKINTGSEYLPATAKIAKNYVEASFIPRSSWRELTLAEYLLLESTDRQWQSGSKIGLVQLPAAELAGLRESLTIADRGIEIADNHLYNTAISQLANYLQAYTNLPQSIALLGLKSSSPGLITTTQDELNYLPAKPYVGLHLDSWEKAPLKRRHQSNNRLCINLGREPRYFLFVNLALWRMFELLGLRDPQDIPQYYRGIGVPELFLRTYPDYPILKLAVAPNEAYIAPTENIIHDASSIDKHQIDLSITFLGKFSVADSGSTFPADRVGAL